MSITVKFTADIYSPELEETYVSGWVDPTLDRFELRELASDVRTFEFDNMEDAMEFVGDVLGEVVDNDQSSGNEEKSYSSADAREEPESGELWTYTALLGGN